MVNDDDDDADKDDEDDDVVIVVAVVVQRMLHHSDGLCLSSCAVSLQRMLLRNKLRKRTENEPKTIENGAETSENGAETKHLNSTRTARPPRAWQFESNSNATEKMVLPHDDVIYR